MNRSVRITVPPVFPASQSVGGVAGAMERFLADAAFSQACGMGAFQRALERYDTSVVLPQMLRTYGDAKEFYRAGAPELSGTAPIGASVGVS